MNSLSKDEKELITAVKAIISGTKNKVAVYVNAELALLYWTIGNYVNTYILQGSRATYSKKIIQNLAVSLTEEFGKGWSERQLRHCLRIAETFPKATIVSAVRRQLSWTHLKTVAYEKDDLIITQIYCFTTGN